MKIKENLVFFCFSVKRKRFLCYKLKNSPIFMQKIETLPHFIPFYQICIFYNNENLHVEHESVYSLYNAMEQIQTTRVCCAMKNQRKAKSRKKTKEIFVNGSVALSATLKSSLEQHVK